MGVSRGWGALEGPAVGCEGPGVESTSIFVALRWFAVWGVEEEGVGDELQSESNPRPSRRRVTGLYASHHVQQYVMAMRQMA